MCINTIPEIAPLARVSLTEAARLLQIGRTTAYRWVESGRLRTYVSTDGTLMATGDDVRRAWKRKKGLLR